jgi:hypothetical protein
MSKRNKDAARLAELYNDLNYVRALTAIRESANLERRFHQAGLRLIAEALEDDQ